MGRVRRAFDPARALITIGDRLAHWASARSDRTFCEFVAAARREAITFGQLYERSLAYASFYAGHGVTRGDVVVIILKHTPHLFYAYLGAILAGAVPTFMPFPSPKQRADFYWTDHRDLFARIQPAMLLTYDENAAKARGAQFAPPLRVEVAHDAILQYPAGLPVRAAADEVACLQHSSGTTGLKKGVMLSHRAIVDEVEAYARALRFGEDDIVASWLPLYHDMGFIACFMASVVLGTRLVMLDPFEWVVRPHLLFEAIERARATFCWLPNFAFAHLVNTARAGRSWDLRSMRAFINCSEPCKAETFERFAAHFASCGVTPGMLHVCYAMAENVFAVTQTAPHERVRVVEADGAAFSQGAVERPRAGAGVRIVSCGLPVDGVAVRIVNAGGRDLSDCAIGEICIRSPFMFSGYYRLPEKTRERVRGGWYFTGDMGFLDRGELFVTGRADDMLIVAGRNYYAHEIEALVNSVEGTTPGRNVAVGVDDTLTGSTAVVVLTEHADGIATEELSHRVRERVLERLGLALAEVVAVPAGSLIKTTSGKLSRSKNKAVYLESKR